MVAYLYTPLIRDNPVEVEHFYCYLGRLAHLHGVTVHQFLSHIDANRRALTGDDRNVVHRVFYERGNALCAYGQDVADVVAAVSEAVGEPDLRVATFLVLRGALSRRTQGLLKRNRAWCPACFADALRENRVPYERLYWLSAHCYRCVFHNIRLVEQCPHCRSFQRGYAVGRSVEGGRTIAHCNHCGRSLVGEPHQWIVDRIPGYGEKEILELVRLSVENPRVEIRSDAVRIFLREYELSLFGECADPALSLPLRDESSTPLIDKALGIALAHNVPLKLLLQEPELASRTAISTMSPAIRPVASRQKRECDIRQELEFHLWVAWVDLRVGLLDESSLAAVCKEVGVSTGYARYHYPDLCIRLENRRRKAIGTRHELRGAAIRKCLGEGLYDKYETGVIRSHDELVLKLVAQCGTTHSEAREGLRLFIQSKSPSRTHE